MHPCFRTPGHPDLRRDMTAAPNRELRRRDPHPPVQQPVSLHSPRLPYSGIVSDVGPSTTGRSGDSLSDAEETDRDQHPDEIRNEADVAAAPG